MEDFINNIKTSTINITPFSHLEINNILDDILYKQISTELNILDKNDFNLKFLEKNSREQIYITEIGKTNDKCYTKLTSNYYKLKDSALKDFVDFLVNNEDYIYDILNSKMNTIRYTKKKIDIYLLY